MELCSEDRDAILQRTLVFPRILVQLPSAEEPGQVTLPYGGGRVVAIPSNTMSVMTWLLSIMTRIP